MLWATVALASLGCDLGMASPLCTNVPENFDELIAPALPLGWVATNAQGPGPLWTTATTAPASPPNYAFVDDPAVISDKTLDTRGVYISSSSVRLFFSHSYILERDAAAFYDGAVLEVSSPNINGGAFTDITNAAVGGSFISGGYNATISTGFGSPIAGRMAWSGNSGGYLSVVAGLGANVVGQTVKLRFRMASDSSTSAGGWSIDGLAVQDFACPLQSTTSRKVHGGAGDFRINLPFNATALLSGIGIETRTGGASNAYQVIFTFASSVTYSGAFVASGTGSVFSTFGSGTPEVIVDLTGVTNAQQIKLILSGVSNGARTGDIVLPMGLLLADANGDGVVNSGDAAITRNHSGEATTAANFRWDYNLDGFINSGDATIVRARSGAFIP